eukprot:CAMPEP_0170070760 /NCGR_PEP_ID=MMETSP0019_2-20121128/8929_1 /TAXON_ID=98059 /ORGANISM="Dinobryon sp., Strain UTEXLB2267" /LENGTH=414 /DNA_ID=CAMNT_0010279115 /DNA_START=715 /DNA_END=1956 /DNA_ORIENTATION=+
MTTIGSNRIQRKRKRDTDSSHSVKENFVVDELVINDGTINIVTEAKRKKRVLQDSPFTRLSSSSYISRSVQNEAFVVSPERSSSTAISICHITPDMVFQHSATTAIRRDQQSRYPSITYDDYEAKHTRARESSLFYSPINLNLEYHARHFTGVQTNRNIPLTLTTPANNSPQLSSSIVSVPQVCDDPTNVTDSRMEYDVDAFDVSRSSISIQPSTSILQLFSKFIMPKVFVLITLTLLCFYGMALFGDILLVSILKQDYHNVTESYTSKMSCLSSIEVCISKDVVFLTNVSVVPDPITFDSLLNVSLKVNSSNPVIMPYIHSISGYNATKFISDDDSKDNINQSDATFVDKDLESIRVSIPATTNSDTDITSIERHAGNDVDSIPHSLNWDSIVSECSELGYYELFLNFFNNGS